jgi:hypothetical protein
MLSIHCHRDIYLTIANKKTSSVAYNIFQTRFLHRCYEKYVRQLNCCLYYASKRFNDRWNGICFIVTMMNTDCSTTHYFLFSLNGLLSRQHLHRWWHSFLRIIGDCHAPLNARLTQLVTFQLRRRRRPSLNKYCFSGIQQWCTMTYCRGLETHRHSNHLLRFNITFRGNNVVWEKFNHSHIRRQMFLLGF